MENAEAKLANFYEKLIIIAKKTGKTPKRLIINTAGVIKVYPINFSECFL